MHETKIMYLHEPETTFWYNNQILHIVVLILISGFILFPRIKNVPLNDWDEARHAINALEIINSGNWVTLTYNHEPDITNIKFPLGAWLIAINYKLFGVNEFSVRLWSVIFTILTTVLVYFWGSLIKDRWSGILAALIFISSMQVVTGHAGITGDYDAGASFFLTLALFLFLTYYKTGKRSFLFYSMAAIGLGTMYKSFVPGFIPLAIILVFLLFSNKRKHFFNPKTIFLCALIIVAIIAPWLIARSMSDSSFVSKLLNFDYWQRFTSPVDKHSGSIFFYLGQMKDGFFPWVYFLPFGLFLALRRYIKDKNEDYLFILLSFFTILSIFSFASTKNFWYILPVFSTMATIVALFWSNIMVMSSKSRFRSILSVTLVGFLIINIVFALLNSDYFFNILKGQNTFSSFIARESVKKELTSSDLIIHEYVTTQSNLFYLKRLLNDKLNIKSEFQCNLKSTQRWLLSSDENFIRLFLKNCPQRKIVSYQFNKSDLLYYLIR